MWPFARLEKPQGQPPARSAGRKAESEDTERPDGRAGSHKLDPVEAELLAAVRAATARPFVDPVLVHGRPMARRDARTIERALVKLGRARA